MTSVPFLAERGMRSGVQHFESAREYYLEAANDSLSNSDERRTGLGDRRQCPVQILSPYKLVDVVQFVHLKITVRLQYTGRPTLTLTLTLT